MPQVQACELPTDALLARYRDQGAYTDCYSTQVSFDVSLADYVSAFYTTWLFKVERRILRLARRPSTDAQAEQLATGQLDRFAAWTVEARAPGQLLLNDMLGRTRSWLMIAPLAGGGTQLYFGSAVVPSIDPRTGRRRMGAVFAGLLPFHKRYSVALLRAARARLGR